MIVKIDILDVDEFIKSRGLKEVTNPIFFNIGNIPTDDGLFSYEIFGPLGSKQRQKEFAFIYLNGRFLHPVMYKMLTQMDRRIISIINGSKFFKIDDLGNLVEDSENGETGLTFLYNNFEKIKFKETDAVSRGEKIKLLKKLNKNQIFIDKIVVIPAFLRDFNPNKSNGSGEVDEINDMYTKIIRIASGLNDNSSFSFITNNSRAALQTEIVNIYDNLTGMIAKKEGLIHKALLGKSVDYATRSVISTQMVAKQTYKDMTVPFGSTGVPLGQVCVLFYPFFNHWISNFIEENEEEIANVLDEEGNKVYIPNVKEQFSEDKIKKLLNTYWRNPEKRFETIRIKDKNGKEYPLEFMKEDLHRTFTLIDLLYIAAYDIVSDKHVYVTRYPVTNSQRIYPSRITIMTTTETTEMQFEDKFLKNYPKVISDYPCEETLFVDTTVMNNLTIGAMGADFDGDTISLRAVFTVEANKEAEELIKKKTMFVDQTGRSSRNLGNEGILALFSLTY